MSRKAFKLFAVLLVGIFAFVPGAFAAEKIIKIGGAVPLSGPVAYWGISTMQGWVDGATEINKKGGVKIGDEYYKIKIITRMPGRRPHALSNKIRSNMYSARRPRAPSVCFRLPNPTRSCQSLLAGDI